MKLILRNFVRGFLVMGLLSGCSDQPDGAMMLDDTSATSGILNSTKVDVKKDALASATPLLNLVFPQEEYDGTCSSTLIGSRVILTAAHCVESFKGRKLKALSAEKPGQFSAVDMLGEKSLIMAVTISKGQVQQLDVEEVAVHKDYSSDGEDEDKKGDIALIKLRKPAPGVMIKVKIDNVGLVRAGRKVLSLGYGNNKIVSKENNEFSSDRTLRRKEFVIKDMSDVEIPENFRDSFFIENSKAARTGGVCSGDSGGPSLMKTDRGYYIVGVLSRAPESCYGLGIMTSVKYYESWIKNQVKAWGLSVY